MQRLCSLTCRLLASPSWSTVGRENGLRGLFSPLRIFLSLETTYLVQLTFVDQLLWVGTAVTSATLLLRLVLGRLLAPPLNGFAVMLAAGLLRDVILLIPQFASHSYAVSWEVTLLPVLAAQSWAAFLVLRSIAGLYPKISSFAVRLFWTFFGVTALVCCAGLYFETRLLAGNEAILRTCFLFDRWVHSLLAGTLVLTMAFFACFPTPVQKRPRNLVNHTLLLSLYFSAYAVYFIAENLAPLGAMMALEYIRSTLAIGLYLTWLCVLSPAGQQIKPWPTAEPALLETVEQRNRNALALLRYAAGK